VPREAERDNLLNLDAKPKRREIRQPKRGGPGGIHLIPERSTIETTRDLRSNSRLRTVFREKGNYEGKLRRISMGTPRTVRTFQDPIF